jgi:MFS family permease
MTQEARGSPQAFAEKLHESVQHVELQAAQLRAQYNRLIIFGTVSSGGSTLVAALTAALGPIVGQGIAGWRLACIVAAILGFAATLCITLSQQLGINEKLHEATQSLGRLKSLDLAVATGSGNWDEITKEYLNIVQSYPDALR